MWIEINRPHAYLTVIVDAPLTGYGLKNGEPPQ